MEHKTIVTVKMFRHRRGKRRGEKCGNKRVRNNPARLSKFGAVLAIKSQFSRVQNQKQRIQKQSSTNHVTKEKDTSLTHDS